MESASLRTVLILASATISATALALALTTAIGDGLESPVVQQIARLAVASDVQVPSEKEYAGRILPRNLFGLDIGRSGGDPPHPAALRGIRLLGTVVADEVVYSSALIVEEGKGAKGFGVGDQTGGGQIVEIRQRQIVLMRDGERHTLDMTQELAGTAPTEEKAAAKPLTRESLENLRPEDLARMGRAMPHRGPDGLVDGWRLAGIRRGSLPDQIGIKNGDIIHSVNGQELDISAWAALHDQTDFEVSLTRRGQQQTLHYSLD